MPSLLPHPDRVLHQIQDEFAPQEAQDGPESQREEQPAAQEDAAPVDGYEAGSEEVSQEDDRAEEAWEEEIQEEETLEEREDAEESNALDDMDDGELENSLEDEEVHDSEEAWEESNDQEARTPRTRMRKKNSPTSPAWRGNFRIFSSKLPLQFSTSFLESGRFQKAKMLENRINPGFFYLSFGRAHHFWKENTGVAPQASRESHFVGFAIFLARAYSLHRFCYSNLASHIVWCLFFVECTSRLQTSSYGDAIPCT